MDTLLKVLESHSGRDRILRTCSYAFTFISGTVKDPRLSAKLRTTATQFSECRVVLRILDDIPMLKYTYMYGLGKQDEDIILRLLNVISNIADQLYYPLEHIAWAGDKKIIPIKNTAPWWNGSTAAWAISLYVSVLKAIRAIVLLQQQKCDIKSGKSSNHLTNLQLNEILSIVAFSCDLCNALHWLPVNFKWTKNLQPWQVGLLGLSSSLIGGYKMLRSLSTMG